METPERQTPKVLAHPQNSIGIPQLDMLILIEDRILNPTTSEADQEKLSKLQKSLENQIKLKGLFS